MKSPNQGGKVFGRFVEPAHQGPDLARRKPGGTATATRLRSMSCSGPSSRARARPPSCSGRSDRPGRCPRDSEQTFGVRAVGEATWRSPADVAGGADGWSGRLCGPPLFAKRALQLASDQAHALGHDEVRPEHLLLGVLEDAGQPAGTGRGTRRYRRIAVHVGLPEGYRGGRPAAGAARG